MLRYTAHRLTVVKVVSKDALCEGVNPIETMVKMRNKPFKNIYVKTYQSG